jgi:hypothetical protein
MYDASYISNGGIIMVKKLLVVLTLGLLIFGANALACQKNSHSNHSIVKNVVKAVSQTGLSAAQTKKIADGIAEYKATMMQIKQMKIFPVDSFIGDEFDENHFIREMSKKYQAKIAAKAALFKFVFAVLDDEQRKVFKRAYAAPLIEKMIHLEMTGGMHHGMGQGVKMGMGNRGGSKMMSPKGCTGCKK